MDSLTLFVSGSGFLVVGAIVRSIAKRKKEESELIRNTPNRQVGKMMRHLFIAFLHNLNAELQFDAASGGEEDNPGTAT
jgi:hypothetical protein